MGSVLEPLRGVKGEGVRIDLETEFEGEGKQGG